MGEFAELLKEERRRSGKKLRETSEAVGLSVSYISDMEQGRKGAPEAEMVIKFQKFFGTMGDILLFAAEAERKEMPTNVMQRMQTRPLLRDVFFRMENKSDEELKEWLKSEDDD